MDFYGKLTPAQQDWGYRIIRDWINKEFSDPEKYKRFLEWKREYHNEKENSN